MISINDVDCQFLIDSQHGLLELTRYVKADWNGMDKEDRDHFWTTEVGNITLSARSVLCDLYDKIENGYYYDGDCGELYERLWVNTPYDFVKRFQDILDEITEFNGAIVLKRREQIDPTIDLEEVKQ